MIMQKAAVSQNLNSGLPIPSFSPSFEAAYMRAMGFLMQQLSIASLNPQVICHCKSTFWRGENFIEKPITGQ